MKTINGHAIFFFLEEEGGGGGKQDALWPM